MKRALALALVAFAVLFGVTTAQAQEGTIVDIAVGDERFETLVTALTEADLVDTLNGPGPFTVFAPTDDAFAALPAGVLDSLLADPQGELRDVLLYHVISGQAVGSETVVTLDSATAANGDTITIEVVDGGVVLNGSVNVIITDLQASNGVIHVIDAVLIPPEDTTPPPPPAPTGSIADIAAADDRFTTLVAALDAAGLVGTLDGPGPFTVFAPTNDAFSRLPASYINELLADPAGELTNVLLFHVVDGEVPASTAVTLSAAPTLLGQTAKVENRADGLYVGGALVTSTDIQATNGIIHVIDAVMIPQNIPTAKPATNEVLITSDFFATNAIVYGNLTGTPTPLGGYDLVNRFEPVDVVWNRFDFAEGENGAYRVAIRQYDPVFEVYTEIATAFHFDENPNGAAFRFSDLSSACTICPSYVVIEPVTYELFLDTATGVFEYEYSSIGAPLQWSQPFAFSQN